MSLPLTLCTFHALQYVHAIFVEIDLNDCDNGKYIFIEMDARKIKCNSDKCTQLLKMAHIQRNGFVSIFLSKWQIYNKTVCCLLFCSYENK